MEADNLVERTALGSVRLSSAIAEGYDGHDGFGVGDAEEGAQGVRIAHAHDEGVESHGAGGKNKEGIAHAVVVRSPAFANLVGGLAVEKAGLAAFIGETMSTGAPCTLRLLKSPIMPCTASIFSGERAT